MNLLTLTDSYKFTHYKQYPPGTEVVYSYFESRGGVFDATLFFGLQYFIKEYLEGVVVTEEKIQELEEMTKAHFGGETAYIEGWRYILEEHGGVLPVRIKAVPEGTLVPTHNVLMTIENTDPKCFWLTNYLETLLVQVWYPTTVATQSYYMKEMISDYMINTNGHDAGIEFKLHDFGFRGVSSVESAGIGGLAHLVNFRGTDTFHALTVANKYYDEPCAGFSIPASEHSTITAWDKENEVEAYRNMLKQYPTGIVACVSDSFDIYNACANLWGKELKDEVLGRDGVLVIRPDSGDPVNVILRCLEILANQFGFTTNDKGFKLLNPKIRLIQGDGVDFLIIRDILQHMYENEWAAENIAFGMGGGLLQKLHRDTQKFAFKCSAVTINGEEKEVFKQPVTDKGKDSKRGRLQLVKNNDGYRTLPDPNFTREIVVNLLETVFENGKLIKNQTLAEIRERSEIERIL